jgi:Tol biopolymer transport system component
MGVLRTWPCVLLVACGARLEGDLPAAEVDGSVAIEPDAAAAASPDAAPDAPAVATWSTPKLIGGVNDAAATEDDPTLSGDRLKIVFISNRGGNADLYIGTRAKKSDPFTVTALTALNSTAVESSPELSTDGTILHFVTRRSGTNQIFRSTFNGTTWAAPAAVASLASLTGADFGMSPDRLTLLAIQPQAAGGNYVMRSERATTADAWGTPARVASLEVTTDVAAPTLTNDGDLVYLHAGSPRDIYISIAGATPTKVEELYSAGRDSAPFVDGINRYIAFARDGELYESTR